MPIKLYSDASEMRRVPQVREAHLGFSTPQKKSSVSDRYCRAQRRESSVPAPG